MWSRDYLDSFDSDPLFDSKLKGNEWANQYLESESIRQNNQIPNNGGISSESLNEQMFNSEWDSLAHGEFIDDLYRSNVNVEYEFQRVSSR